MAWCQYCDYTEGHNNGCPTYHSEDPKKLSEWEEGYKAGNSYEELVENSSDEWALGWHVGYNDRRRNVDY